MDPCRFPKNVDLNQRTGLPAWRWSRANLERLPSQQLASLNNYLETRREALNISRVIISDKVIGKIKAGKVNLENVSESDLRACVKPRAIFEGNVLDLRDIHTYKRGPIKVISDILFGWLLIKFPRLRRKSYDYAFMVHPRNYADVLQGVPFLKYIPEKWGRAFVKKLPPFKLSTMTGLVDIKGEPIKGALMCVGWDREMFEQDMRGREEKIADLVKLAKHMGIRYVGFAALLPWASRYGQCLEGSLARAEIETLFKPTAVKWEDLKGFFVNPEERNLKPRSLAEIKEKLGSLNADKDRKKQFLEMLKWALRVGSELEKMTITTGHPFTISIITSFIKKLLELHPQNNPLIAVVGAAGSTGSCCCLKMTAEGVNNFLLVDREKSTGVMSLDQLREEMLSINPGAKVATSTNLSDLKKADIVIVVSSASGTIIESHFLKPGAIVVDDSQPRNVDPAIAKERPDIRIITVLAPLGGLIPGFYFDKHTPFTDACFTCAGDVSLRARTNTPISATGPATLDGVETVERMVATIRTKIGFDPLEPVFYTYDRGVISYEEIKQIASLTLAS